MLRTGNTPNLKLLKSRTDVKVTAKFEARSQTI